MTHAHFRGSTSLSPALLAALLAAILLLAAWPPAAGVLAQAERYPGESTCRDVPAWPNGSYLGQMHPYHSDFHTRYAEKRDWDPCATWAADQRLSAIRGLRALGYTVPTPGQSIPAPAPAADANGAVPAENYPGENYCRDVPAWPNGAYLGQMHPYHSEFYTRYADKRDWDPCATWAADQRRSAIRGLRELGYTVLEPGQAITAPTPAPTPDPTPAPTPGPTPAPMDDAEVRYQEISGWNGGGGVLELPAGDHEVRAAFGGWWQGPVTVFYTTPDGETVTLIDNSRTGYARRFTITAAVAGGYKFQVRATRDWRVAVGTPPATPSPGSADTSGWTGPLVVSDTSFGISGSDTTYTYHVQWRRPANAAAGAISYQVECSDWDGTGANPWDACGPGAAATARTVSSAAAWPSVSFDLTHASDSDQAHAVRVRAGNGPWDVAHAEIQAPGINSFTKSGTSYSANVVAPNAQGQSSDVTIECSTDGGATWQMPACKTGAIPAGSADQTLTWTSTDAIDAVRVTLSRHGRSSERVVATLVGAPYSMTFYGVGETQVTVFISKPLYPTGAFAYTVEYSIDHGQTWADFMTFASTAASSVSRTVNEPSALGRVNAVRARATQSGADSAWATTFGKPGGVERLRAKYDQSDTTLAVSWDRPLDPHGAYSYAVKCSKTGILLTDFQNCANVTRTTAASLGVTIKTSGYLYVQVVAYGGGGPDDDFYPCGLPCGPQAPTGVGVTASTSGDTRTYSVGWSRPSALSGAVNYTVQCRTDHSNWRVCGTNPVNSSDARVSVTITQSTANFTWTHVRVGTNAAGPLRQFSDPAPVRRG